MVNIVHEDLTSGGRRQQAGIRYNAHSELARKGATTKARGYLRQYSLARDTTGPFSMVDLGSADEAEMILAFLKAEECSPRFAVYVSNCLGMLRADRTLISRADITDSRQNELRKVLLGCYRGYGKDASLFRGFPIDVTWRRVRLNPTDLDTIVYGNEDQWDTRKWTELSRGTRRVAVGARNIEQEPKPGDPLLDVKRNILAVGEKIQLGVQFPELILVDSGKSTLIIVEGATRSTAYVRERATDVEAFVGYSRGISRWVCYS